MVKELITNLYKLAECEQAERITEMALLTYEHTIKNGTAFDRTDIDMETPGRRLFAINPMNFKPKNIDIARAGFARLVIAEWATYLHKGYIDQDKFSKVKELYYNDAESSTEFDSIMTVQQAAASLWWLN